jgi:(1->4)-alpha-D-glucan 1-alpha-D-glucosylmutase
MDPGALLEHRSDGRIKLFVIMRGLALRAAMRDAFEQGEYIPLTPAGLRADCLFAFARRHAEGVAITCVPRLVAMLIPDAAAPPIGRTVCGDTRIVLPADLIRGPLRDALTGATLAPDMVEGAGSLPAAAVFERLPVALLAAG